LEGADWIYLAQNGVQMRVIVNTVMSIRIPKSAGNLLT